MKIGKAFVVFFLFLFVVSCQSTSKTRQQKIQFNIASDPTTLDPRKSRALNERTLMSMFFEGLMREGKEGKNELALAESMEIKNEGTRYVFRLKKAFWSNGDPIRAEDFVYAWKTALDPNFPSENAYQLFCIKNAEKIKKAELASSELGVQALDSHTLQIDLEKQIPYFSKLLSFPIFFPVHELMDKRNWSLQQEPLICSGPFCVKQWKHNSHIEAIKNLNYWDKDVVSLEKIHLLMVAEETEVKMFEKKELDWAGSPLSTLPFDLIEGFQKKQLIHFFPMFGTAFLRINVESFPFNNPNIRKALALAINRTSLVEHVTKGGYLPALRFVPTSMGMEKDSYFVDADEEKAREFFQKGLKEMGLEHLPPLKFLHCNNQNNHILAQAIQEDWRRVLGVFVELEVNEKNVYLTQIGKGNYQIALGSWIADFNDPVNFLEIFKYKNGFTNNTYWENSDYVHLLEESETSQEGMRKDLLCKCEEILMEEMPIIPLYHQSMRYIKHPYVKDVILSSLGNVDFKWAYVEQDKGKI